MSLKNDQKNNKTLIKDIMEHLYTLKNKIVQGSLNFVEKRLQGPETHYDINDTSNKNFHQYGTLTFEEFKRASIYFCSKNKKWSITGSDIIYRDSVITNNEVDGYIDESVEDNWGLYEVEGSSKVFYDDLTTVSGTSTTISSGTSQVILRTYDVIITYDKLFQVPKIFIRGYSHGIPISSTELYNYFVDEYKNRTVTVENHEEYGPCVSIHPCNHAKMMKAIVPEEAIVEEYIVYFINIISTVIPLNFI
jgi:hypothetical protein